MGEPLEITCHQSTEGLSGKELRVRPEGWNLPQSQALSFTTEQTFSTGPKQKRAVMLLREKTNAALTLLKNDAVNSMTYVISGTARQIILRTTVIPFPIQNIIEA